MFNEKWFIYFMTFFMLLSANLFAQDCGLSGTIEDRIEDCKRLPESNFTNLELVSRSYSKIDKRMFEVWKDKITGYIWSDKISESRSKKYLFEAAKRACGSQLEEMVGIKGQWSLPSVKEFLQLDFNDQNEVFDLVEFWTSSIGEKYPIVWVYKEKGSLYAVKLPQTSGVFKYFQYNVRCVLK